MIRHYRNTPKAQGFLGPIEFACVRKWESPQTEKFCYRLFTIERAQTAPAGVAEWQRHPRRAGRKKGEFGLTLGISC